MFTLKLYRRDPRDGSNVLRTRIEAVDHVEVIHFAPGTLEVLAFHGPDSGPYTSWYIGERTAEMTAVNDDNHWGWGLLENWEGNTTQHFRPHTYG